jgi:hypothetical protein
MFSLTVNNWIFLFNLIKLIVQAHLKSLRKMYFVGEKIHG